MSTIPPRPEVHPYSWITAFWYSDKMTGGSGLSRPLAHTGKKTAIAAADSARSENGGGIRVMFGYAWPPIDSDEKPYFVNLQ